MWETEKLRTVDTSGSGDRLAVVPLPHQYLGKTWLPQFSCSLRRQDPLTAPQRGRLQQNRRDCLVQGQLCSPAAGLPWLSQPDPREEGFTPPVSCSVQEGKGRPELRRVQTGRTLEAGPQALCAALPGTDGSGPLLSPPSRLIKSHPAESTEELCYNQLHHPAASRACGSQDTSTEERGVTDNKSKPSEPFIATALHRNCGCENRR